MVKMMPSMKMAKVTALTFSFKRCGTMGHQSLLFKSKISHLKVLSNFSWPFRLKVFSVLFISKLGLLVKKGAANCQKRLILMDFF